MATVDQGPMPVMFRFKLYREIQVQREVAVMV